MSNIYRDAIDVQDEHDCLVVVRLLANAAEYVAAFGGSADVYGDPAIVLIANKFAAMLNADQRFSHAYDLCKQVGGR